LHLLERIPVELAGEFLPQCETTKLAELLELRTANRLSGLLVTARPAAWLPGRLLVPPRCDAPIAVAASKRGRVLRAARGVLVLTRHRHDAEANDLAVVGEAVPRGDYVAVAYKGAAVPPGGCLCARFAVVLAVVELRRGSVD